MKKTGQWMLVLLLVMSITLIGCAKKDGGSAASSGEKKIGMITDTGGVNDNSYNQSAWEGFQRLGQDKGIEVKYLEGKGDADYEPNLNQFVQQKWDMIWGLGFAMDEAIIKVANANKNVHFGIVDSDLGGNIPDNVVAVTHKEEEGSFLVGVIAGLVTKTDKVGFIGGVDFATINKFEYGFRAGVKAVNPGVEVISVYTGSFVAPDLGKQTAATMYDNGVDIIYHAAGPTGAGLFNEAKERKDKGDDVWVIGVDSDQSLAYGSDITLTSMIKRTDQAVYLMSEKFLNGEFEGGKVTQLGLAEQGVGIAPTSDVNVPKDVLDEVEQFREWIISGEIKAPATKPELDSFNFSK